MKMSPAALVLDDDPVVLKLLSLRLKRRFPELNVECHTQPVAVGVYDVYILDNEFHGRPLAADLAEHIKRQQPQSLVLALSGTLDVGTLKRLINCGCAGAFDKNAPADIEALMTSIADYLDDSSFTTFRASRPRARVGDTARAIAALIRDWNRRLELEERREQHDQQDHPARPILDDGDRAAKTIEWRGENIRM